MSVEELIKELQKVKNKKIPVYISWTKVTWSGGCETCGYGAEKSEESESDIADDVYDLESRVIIESKS